MNTKKVRISLKQQKQDSVTPTASSLTKRESIVVLEECMDLQIRKSQDYQNPNSNVLQAMHYRCGINTLQDVMQTKLYRAQSLLETAENPSTTLEVTPNFESLEDTYKDLINYASFAVAWLRGGIPGQKTDRDIFNKIIPENFD